MGMNEALRLLREVSGRNLTAAYARLRILGSRRLSTFRSADACALLPSSELGTWNHVAISHDGTTDTVTFNYN